MKANTTISADLYDNSDKFTDPFFDRFELRPGPEPLQLNDEIAKTYQFPTFYGDVTCAIAIFMCDYGSAQAMMPHPLMKPVRMPRGRSVVVFSCYEYRNVTGIDSYNEIAMTIPVMVGGDKNPLVLPLIKDYDNKGYYVFSMPVTSLENQIRGQKIWGLPKVVEEISLLDSEHHCTTTAKDEQGTTYFELKVPKTGKAKHFDETGYLYSMLNKQLQKSQTNFKGDFNINSNLSRLWSKGQKAATPILILGDSPRAQVLKDLQVEAVPFQTRYTKSMNSCFDLPLGQW